MKDKKVLVGIFCFMLGVVSVSVWKKQNYVSIPKENVNRNIASQSTGQQVVIDDFTSKILAMKSKDDVNKTVKYIEEVSKNYPQFVGVQLFNASFQMLPVFKGIIWRLRGVVEDTDITHSMVLSYLRFFYSSQYVYGPHVMALFHYFADPEPTSNQFRKISDLQNFLYKDVRPYLVQYLVEAQKSLSQNAEFHHFSLDRRIYIGADEDKRFFDEVEAKKEYIKPYTSYVISGLARTIGSIDYFYSYNFDDMPKIMQAVLRKSAINSILGRFKLRPGKRESWEDRSLPKIMSKKEIFDIVDNYKKFGTLRFEEAESQKYLNESYSMFALASEHDLKGYVCSIQYPSTMMSGGVLEDSYKCDWSFMEDESFQEEEYFVVGGSKFLVDPNLLLINHRQDFHELHDRYRIYHPVSEDGIVSITSDATGQVVRIMAQGAFKAQKDLKNFLPVEFSTNYKSDTVTVKNDVGAYNKNGQWEWNYDYGRPTKWRSQYVTFGGLFPDLTNDNAYDIMASVRLTRSLRPFSNLFTTIP